MHGPNKAKNSGGGRMLKKKLANAANYKVQFWYVRCPFLYDAPAPMTLQYPSPKIEIKKYTLIKIHCTCLHPRIRIGSAFAQV